MSDRGRFMNPGELDREFASPGELEEAIGKGLSNRDRLEWLRTESREIGLYGQAVRVDLWDTQERDQTGRSILAYRLCIERESDLWEIVFSGEDFHLAPSIDADSILALAELLGFFQPSAERSLTPMQQAFLVANGEALALWGAEIEAGGEPDEDDEQERWIFAAQLSIVASSEEEARAELEQLLVSAAGWDEPKVLLVRGRKAEAEPLDEGNQQGVILTPLERAAYKMLDERLRATEGEHPELKPKDGREGHLRHRWLVQQAQKLATQVAVDFDTFEPSPAWEGSRQSTEEETS